MRIFTAIPIPEETKKTVAEITRNRLPVPYVNTTNLHITLNFFGELDSDQVNTVRRIFPEVCSGRHRFSLEFARIVAHHNRQIHATVRPTPELSRLQQDLEQTFRQHGFEFQHRPFYAHMKLANMHLDNVMNRDRKLENFPHEELAKLDFTATRIVLYESKLLLHHPKYIPLMEQKLI